MITALRFVAGMGAFATVWTALALRSGVFLSSPRSIELYKDTPFIKKLWAAFWAFVFLCIVAAFFIFPTLRASVRQLPKEVDKNLQSYERKNKPATEMPVRLGSFIAVAPPRDKGWSMVVRCPKGARIMFGSQNGIRIRITFHSNQSTDVLEIPPTPMAFAYAKRGIFLKRQPGASPDWPGATGQLALENMSFQFQSVLNKDEEVACFMALEERA